MIFRVRIAIFDQIQWNFASFGALMFLGCIGLSQAQRERVFLSILAALAFIITNLLNYKLSWDIVKFGTVAFIVLGIGTGIALSNLAGGTERSGRRLLLGTLIVIVGAQGILYPYLLLFASYNPNGRAPFSMQMIRPYFSEMYPVSRDDALAVSFLRTHMGRSDIVYRAEEKSEPYAIWGGLPTQASVYAENGTNDIYGLGEVKFAARKNLSDISEDWLERLAAEHVTWIVANSKDAAVNAALELATREARSRAGRAIWEYSSVFNSR